MKVINKPLVNIDGVDINGNQLSEEELKKLSECLDKYKSKQNEIYNRIKATERNGEVYVEGLGWVKSY